MREHIQRFSDELAREPDSTVFIALADALRREQQFDTALHVAHRGLQRHPYLADGHDVLARIYADMENDERARDEWETTLRLTPGHLSALKGIGFLAFKCGDFATAESKLREALEQQPDDDASARALERVLAEARGPKSEARAGESSGPRPSALGAASPTSSLGPPTSSRALFATLLGEADRTALLLDRDGLVMAGAYVDENGTDVAAEVGAELAGLGDEATRALGFLGLGAWSIMLVEADHATAAMAPAPDAGLVLVAATPDTPVGFVRMLLGRASDRARTWLETVA
jgi:tetratricopeptide (TPR) repeat protein